MIKERKWGDILDTVSNFLPQDPLLPNISKKLGIKIRNSGHSLNRKRGVAYGEKVQFREKTVHKKEF